MIVPRWSAAALPCVLVSVQWLPASVTVSLAIAPQALEPQRKTIRSEWVLISPCGAFVSTTAGLSEAAGCTTVGAGASRKVASTAGRWAFPGWACREGLSRVIVVGPPVVEGW